MANRHPLGIEWGHNIKAQREARHMTQAELARRLNVTRAAVSYWESGDRIPDDRRKAAIAAVFGISPRTLFPIFPTPDTERAA